MSHEVPAGHGSQTDYEQKHFKQQPAPAKVPVVPPAKPQPK